MKRQGNKTETYIQNCLKQEAYRFNQVSNNNFIKKIQRNNIEVKVQAIVNTAITSLLVNGVVVPFIGSGKRSFIKMS
jgi:hypothetical protein